MSHPGQVGTPFESTPGSFPDGATLQQQQRKASAGLKAMFDKGQREQWLNALHSGHVSRGRHNRDPNQSPVNEALGHAMLKDTLYTIGDPSAPPNEVVEKLNHTGRNSYEVFRAYAQKDPKWAKNRGPVDQFLLSKKLFQARRELRDGRAEEREQMIIHGTWTDEMEAEYKKLHGDWRNEGEEKKKQGHAEPPENPESNSSDERDTAVMITPAMGSELAIYPPIEDGQAPLYVPFDPIDMNEYFHPIEQQYLPGKYLGSVSVGKPRLELMKLYEWNSEVRDARPQPDATPPDLYSDVPFDQLDQAGKDQAAFEHLCARIGEEVGDLNYMFDLVYRMTKCRDELRILQPTASPEHLGLPLPVVPVAAWSGAPSSPESAPQPPTEEQTTGHEGSEVGPLSGTGSSGQGPAELPPPAGDNPPLAAPDGFPPLTIHSTPQSPGSPIKGEGGKAGELQPPTDPSGDGNGRLRSSFLEVIRMFQRLNPWGESEEQKHDKLQREAGKEQQEKMKREKIDREHKRYLERQERPRRRREEMEKEQEADVKNWMNFIKIKDCTGEKRWVVADSKVHVPEDLKYLDDCEYQFTPESDPKPLSEFKDPRELYTTDERPDGGFPCENLPDCRCFYNSPTALPKTALFNTSDGRGIGLRALHNIKKGEYIGEYRGVIKVYDNTEKSHVFEDMKKRDLGYAVGGHWDANTDFGVDGACSMRSVSYYIDALKSGTETRFINHHCDPNVVNVEYVNENHKGRMVQAIRATKLIHKGWEVLIDYGKFDDWRVYGGQCLCRSDACRYLVNIGAGNAYTVTIQYPNNKWIVAQLAPNPVIEPFNAAVRLRTVKTKRSYHFRHETFKRRQSPMEFEHKKSRHDLTVWPDIRIKVLYRQHCRPVKR